MTGTSASDGRRVRTCELCLLALTTISPPVRCVGLAIADALCAPVLSCMVADVVAFNSHWNRGNDGALQAYLLPSASPHSCLPRRFVSGSPGAVREPHSRSSTACDSASSCLS